jgi:hypothetical protein
MEYVVLTVSWVGDDHIHAGLHVIPSAIRHIALARAFPSAIVDRWALHQTRLVMGHADLLAHRAKGVDRVRAYHATHMGYDWPPMRFPAPPKITAARVYAQATTEFVPWYRFF